MLEDILLSGQVIRYHANPYMNRTQQTVAEHCWGVAALIYKLNPNPSRALIAAALFHDSGEMWAGDLPAPFKMANPELAARHAEIEEKLATEAGVPVVALNESELAWLKFADRLESFLFMRQHGQHWSREGINELLERATALGVNHETQQIIGGN